MLNYICTLYFTKETYIYIIIISYIYKYLDSLLIVSLNVFLMFEVPNLQGKKNRSMGTNGQCLIFRGPVSYECYNPYF